MEKLRAKLGPHMFTLPMPSLVKHLPCCGSRCQQISRGCRMVFVCSSGLRCVRTCIHPCSLRSHECSPPHHPLLSPGNHSSFLSLSLVPRFDFSECCAIVIRVDGWLLCRLASFTQQFALRCLEHLFTTSKHTFSRFWVISEPHHTGSFFFFPVHSNGVVVVSRFDQR